MSSGQPREQTITGRRRRRRRRGNLRRPVRGTGPEIMRVACRGEAIMLPGARRLERAAMHQRRTAGRCAVRARALNYLYRRESGLGPFCSLASWCCCLGGS